MRDPPDLLSSYTEGLKNVYTLQYFKYHTILRQYISVQL
jgi:hypothetical protein